MTEHEADVLVVGSGIAGLTFALKVADHGRVALITKKERAESNTNYAQGGIAAVMDPHDSFDAHVRDTLQAGAGLCHPDAVRRLVQEGPQRVRELMDWGVRFTRDGQRLSLGREGGHSHRRIVHADDLTGKEIERALLDAVEDHPAIALYEDHTALDLILTDSPRRCAGALVLDRHSGALMRFRSRFTMLASGGLGQVYRHTTNADIATGDGIAMAYRAGCPVANLEFVQFHPTALYPADGRAFLISEAVRGEGAILRTVEGTPLLSDHPLGSLATRDVVARAIDRTLKETGREYVHLDLSPIPRETIERRFPNILAECARRGFDALSEPLPVVPAAHYVCGGVPTDWDGRTALDGLLAAGEVACTGVHGANRLASNSLLEAVVYSHRAAMTVRAGLDPAATGAGGEIAPESLPGTGEPTRAKTQNWEATRAQLRTLMWNRVGIVRSDARLMEAESEVRALRKEVAADWRACLVADALAELRNLADVALLVVRCARARAESRGLHYNVDHPRRDDEHFGEDTVLNPAGPEESST